MKARIDSNILSILAKRGYISQVEALKMATLPLFEFTVDVTDTTSEWGKFLNNFKPMDLSLSLEDFYFYDCVLYIHSHVKDLECYCRFVGVGTGQWQMSIAPAHSPNHWSTFQIECKEHDDDFDISLIRFNNIHGGEKISKTYAITNESVTMVAQSALAAVSAFQAWCRFNDQKDRYAISVEPSDKKRPTVSLGFRRRLQTTIGPRVIFLDRLPSSDSTNGDTGRTVTGHDRKGYHYTLRHERYRKHPYFQMEKKMYKKPVWVGERSVDYQGATYTVVDKDTRPTDDD